MELLNMLIYCYDTPKGEICYYFDGVKLSKQLRYGFASNNKVAWMKMENKDYSVIFTKCPNYRQEYIAKRSIRGNRPNRSYEVNLYGGDTMFGGLCGFYRCKVNG